MAIDMTGLIDRLFSVPPGGFILRDVFQQLFDPATGHTHDGVNSAPTVQIVAAAPTMNNSMVGVLYYCTADSRFYFNNGTAVVKSSALS